jgi:protein transport protein DSL1/ZW10
LALTDGRKDAQKVLECLSSVFVFLYTQFPTRLGSVIGKLISEEVVGMLIREWLTPAIPLSLSDLRQSENMQTSVRDLADLVFSYQWHGHKELKDWLEGLPRIWLEKRRNSALDAVRKAFKAQHGLNKEVQRVERQNISKWDDTLAQNGLNDWSEGRTEEAPKATAASSNMAIQEEEDLSGWDFEEDVENTGSASSSPTKANGESEDASDAWGWNDDNADETRPADSGAEVEEVNHVAANGSTDHREVTMTETYTVTDIPDYVLDIVSGEVRDAEQMKTSEYAAFESISASVILWSLPTLILAMFRATAPAYYSSAIPSGNMHLYNDCMYMVEQLRDKAYSMSSTQMLEDCDALERFAKSAYAREMDVQRTVLGDLLDGAQGFVNCARFPYSAECENAVSSVIDRLRAVHDEWSTILSRSALLQSIGSLLSRVIEKVVKDVEEMEDISEAESQRLTAFCSQISALEYLFLSERPAAGEGADAEVVPLTAVYVSNWLRFQYLSNILESSLVDIKYLWTEGELSLDFSADEVIELIEALFAESSHRRNAIAEIRRSRP